MPIRFNSKQNKFNAKKWPCKQLGTKCKRKHDSKAEAGRCDQLSLLESAGRITYKSQIRYNLVVDGYLICYHNVDFEVIKNGVLFVEDVKGMCTPEWKIKYKLFRALYPDIKYIVNFNGNFGKGKIPPMKLIATDVSKQESLL